MITLALIRPFQLLAIYTAFLYGLLHSLSSYPPLFALAYPGFPSVFLTIMPNVFADIYNETSGIAGLHYIALGVGLTTACQLNARLLNRIYIHYKNKKGGVGEPEFRLRELLLSSLFRNRY